MKFKEAKNLHKNDRVLIIEKTGKNPIYRSEYVVEVEIDDKDAFIRCSDGRLYHHRALKSNNT